MGGRPKRASTARRRAIVACAALLAVVGSVLIAAPANAVSPDASSSDTRTPAVGAASTLDSPLLSASSAASTASVATVRVIRSSNTVYPVKDGYIDTVRFAVIATNAKGISTPVIGSAVLTGAGRIIHTWRIDGAMTAITWDGRVAHAVRTGHYALTVTASSSDGTIRTGESLVRVSGKRLVRHEIVTTTRVDRHTTVKLMPSHLLGAFSHGRVWVRIVTAAVVHGPAKLIYSNDGTTATIPLRNGTHTTPELPVPQGFNRVTVTHGWAPGVAKLKSLKTIWIYYDLE